jgi:hypothetical protein
MMMTRPMSRVKRLPNLALFLPVLKTRRSHKIVAHESSSKAQIRVARTGSLSRFRTLSTKLGRSLSSLVASFLRTFMDTLLLLVYLRNTPLPTT